MLGGFVAMVQLWKTNLIAGLWPVARSTDAGQPVGLACSDLPERLESGMQVPAVNQNAGA